MWTALWTHYCRRCPKFRFRPTLDIQWWVWSLCQFFICAICPFIHHHLSRIPDRSFEWLKLFSIHDVFDKWTLRLSGAAFSLSCSAWSNGSPWGTCYALLFQRPKNTISLCRRTYWLHIFREHLLNPHIFCLEFLDRPCSANPEGQ